jgi:hypothetical protein
MRSVTHLVDRYREAARALWNNSLWRVDVSFDTVDAFNEVSRLLFREIVLQEVGKADFVKGRTEPFPFLRVVPTGTRVPLLVNRPSDDGNLYWDDPVNRIDPNDADLFLVDCYDWDPRGFRDLAYYQLRIGPFRAHPDCTGRLALMERIYAEVYFDDKVQGMAVR